MTKLESRKKELSAHYLALQKLAATCGIKADGKKLSVALLKLERQAHQDAEDYCNGIMDGNKYEELEPKTLLAVQILFNNRLKGFFVNSDPRGCALKIDDAVLKSEYADIGLQRDWGGYGLLAPEIQ